MTRGRALLVLLLLLALPPPAGAELYWWTDAEARKSSGIEARSAV